jgi:hypothetical protein
MSFHSSITGGDFPEPKLTFARLATEMYAAYRDRLAVLGEYVPQVATGKEAEAWEFAAIAAAGLVDRKAAMRPYWHGKN